MNDLDYSRRIDEIRGSVLEDNEKVRGNNGNIDAIILYVNEQFLCSFWGRG